MSRHPLVNQAIWIAGASTGIGRALALELARKGNRVFVSARNRSLISMLALEDPRIEALPCDITDSADVERCVEEIAQRAGKLDLLILNAGICEYLDGGEVDLALVRRVFETNFFGVLQVLAAALPLLSFSRTPYVVAVGSLAADLPLPRAEAYGSSKIALKYFLETLRVDLFRKGIAISIASPGFVKTPLTDRNDFPMPFLIDTDQAVRYLISGMERRLPEIRFPRFFALMLRLLSVLPRAPYTRLAQRMILK